MANKEDS